MSRRHGAARRRSYGPRQRDLRRRAPQILDLDIESPIGSSGAVVTDVDRLTIVTEDLRSARASTGGAI